MRTCEPIYHQRQQGRPTPEPANRISECNYLDGRNRVLCCTGVTRAQLPAQARYPPILLVQYHLYQLTIQPHSLTISTFDPIPFTLTTSNPPFIVHSYNTATATKPCKTSVTGFLCLHLSLYIKTLMKMATNAGLVGHFTNHSVRKTMCTQLLHAGVPPTTIAQLSGHKNVQSINQYAVASKEQQQSMCQILQGQKPSSPALDITVKRPALVPLTSDNSLQAVLPSKQPRYGYASNSNDPVNPGIAASNVNSSQTHSMISGLFAEAVFHGPVNITFSK